jgi:hypothetical protein
MWIGLISRRIRSTGGRLSTWQEVLGFFRKIKVSLLKWKKRRNEELYQLHGETEIVNWIRSARLRWAGHIVTTYETVAQVINQRLTCSWVKERWEDPRGNGLRKWREREN